MKDKSSNIETDNNILIILGMHRSGTSLTANWLNLCGLNLGDRMFGSNEFNPTGHFEDWDFLEFHNSVLNRNKAPFFVSENTPLQINDTDIKKAKELAINKNSKHKQWGWKDPRTCVFIDIWNNAIPNAKYLVIFRDVENCVDSLLRRKAKKEAKIQISKKSIFKRSNKIISSVRKEVMEDRQHINELFNSWKYHNQCILNSIKEKDMNDYLIVKNSDLVRHSKNIYEKFTNEWGFELSYTNPETIIKEDLMKKDINFNLKIVDQSLIDNCKSISKELLEKSIYH